MISMRRFFTVVLLTALFAAIADAHPGSGIVVDRQGRIFFTDTSQGVWMIDMSGKLTYFHKSNWHWMAIDEEGRFSNSRDTFGEWFQRVSPGGSKPALITCSDYPFTIHSDGNLYYADTRRRPARIVRRTPDGRESDLATLATGEAYEKTDQTVFVTGITSDPDGSLYVMEASGQTDIHVLRKVTAEGTVSVVAKGFIANAGVKGPPGPEGGSGYCRGLAVDSRGAVYVAVTGSRRVVKIMPDGVVTTVLEAAGPWTPTGVALFSDEVYVLEYDLSGSTREDWKPRVQKIGRDGTIRTLATVKGNTR